MRIIEFDSHKVALLPIGEGNVEALTPTDIAHIDSISSPSRKAEQIAWRTALRSLIGTKSDIVYLPSGAPILTNTAQHISVSHNTKWAAVAIGNTKCGIDIELLARNFERIASRYISPEEAQLPESAHPLFKPLLWSAKETIYKYVATEGVDFTEDIRIVATDTVAQKLWAEFRGEPLPALYFRTIDSDSILTFIG
ncbi:MAG: 4'-phosphopantetheinyl transferase superfamily protein [Tidjanibacter sp.]|nr:4'-phosphopantetheinyl transferase superfamily protein [Tidjanibacter sp.]